jgi:hypothetical protein
METNQKLTLGDGMILAGLSCIARMTKRFTIRLTCWPAMSKPGFRDGNPSAFTLTARSTMASTHRLGS